MQQRQLIDDFELSFKVLKERQVRSISPLNNQNNKNGRSKSVKLDSEDTVATPQVPVKHRTPVSPEIEFSQISRIMKILTYKLIAQFRWGFQRIYIMYEKQQHELEKYLSRKKLRLLVNCFNLWKGVAKNSHLTEKDFNIRQKNLEYLAVKYYSLQVKQRIFEVWKKLKNEQSKTPNAIFSNDIKRKPPTKVHSSHQLKSQEKRKISGVTEFGKQLKQEAGQQKYKLAQSVKIIEKKSESQSKKQLSKKASQEQLLNYYRFKILMKCLAALKKHAEHEQNQLKESKRYLIAKRVRTIFFHWYQQTYDREKRSNKQKVFELEMVEQKQLRQAIQFRQYYTQRKVFKILYNNSLEGQINIYKNGSAQKENQMKINMKSKSLSPTKKSQYQQSTKLSSLIKTFRGKSFFDQR